MARFGGTETPEEHAHMGTIDVLGGIAGAFGAAAAILQRERGGTRRFVKTSLAAAGQLLQVQYMYHHKDRAPFDEPSGREVKGDGPFYRCYETSDGSLFLAVSPDNFDALARVTGIEDITSTSPEHQTRLLSEAFSGATTGHWCAQLKPLDVCAVPLGSLETLRARFTFPADSSGPAGVTYRFIQHTDHPCERDITLVDWAGVRPAVAPLVTGSPAPKYGAQTRTILAELGYPADVIERLFADGTVSESWSKDYMPT